MIQRRRKSELETLIFVLEVIGTLSFAVSGAFTAIRKDMDVFGVAILGLTTAVGGGMIRDLILGITPPATFREPMWAIMAILVSIAVFILVYMKKLHEHGRVYDIVMLLTDTVGLAAFTIAGIGAATAQQVQYSNFLMIFVGVITGVGGGVIRDLFAGDRPYIFVKHVYASASIIGAIITVFLAPIMGSEIASIYGMSVIIVLRLLSAHFKWNLPKIPHREEEK